MLNQALICAMLMIGPGNPENRPFDFPKQDALIEFNEARDLTRRERRINKRSKNLKR